MKLLNRSFSSFPEFSAEKILGESSLDQLLDHPRITATMRVTTAYQEVSL